MATAIAAPEADLDGPGFPDDPEDSPSALDVALGEAEDEGFPDAGVDPSRRGQPREVIDLDAEYDPDTGERIIPQQQQQQQQQQDGDDVDHVLEEFDLGDGRFEDLSFSDIREAVNLRERYNSEFVARNTLQGIARRMQEEFGAATPHYAGVTKLHGELQAYLKQVDANLEPPSMDMLDGTQEGAEKYKAQRLRYEAQQERINEGRRLAQEAANEQKTRSDKARERQQDAMYDALEKLWPDSMSEDADTRKGVVALLQSYGFGVDEFLDAGDIRLVRMFSDLQKSQATLKRARQARGNRGAPRIVRKATTRRGQAGRRGQQQQQQRQPNRLRNVWMNQGGPEAITVGGEEILAAMRT